MIVGYARVSTKKQNIDRQMKRLEEYGCEKIFMDKKSGKNLQREEYQKMKKFIFFGAGRPLPQGMNRA